MSRITPTDVMIARNDELARDPKHLKRLMEFWPRENIVHRIAKMMLEMLEQQETRKVFTCTGCGHAVLDEHPSDCDCMEPDAHWAGSELFTSSAPAAVPDGWKLVPIVPFPSQWAAGQKAFDSAGINKVDPVYSAMVVAAPAPGAAK